MNRNFSLLLCAVLCTFSLAVQAQQREFTFAWLTDVHIGSFAYAEDDLRQAIEDINQMPEVDFTILSGDLTEFGDTKEFLLVQEILQGFKKPCLFLPGNHDVNWSENGTTMFDKIFGASHFCFDHQGVRFIGCGAGPSLRMGPPTIPHEEILWLDSTLTATPKEMPIIFVNHFPLQQSLSNWYEAIDLLKTRNIQAALAGHFHVNQPYDAEGIPAFIGRSSLRRKDPIGGYNLVSIKGNKMTISERIIKTETRPAWGEATLTPIIERTDTTYYRPEYSLNNTYPQVKQVWSRKDISDVASQGTLEGHLYLYTDIAGSVYALDSRNGKELWSFTTGNKLFATPYIDKKLVIVPSTDGNVYALDKKTGNEVWKYDTGYPIVACPIVADDAIYIGSSNGYFYSLTLKDGSLNWRAEGLKGYIESRPAVDKERVYIGTWGAMFYAFDRRTGANVWEFDTGRGRYFSPGACWPQVVSYEQERKMREQVIVLSSDYFVRAFNPTDGAILWQSDEAKGRESIGLSADGRILYIKGIKNNITAVDISQGSYRKLWDCPMPYESNFIPTRLENTDELIFIPTEFGVVHAVKSDGSGIAWSHKVSHSAVTSLQNAGKGRLIVMTMDGTVKCLQY